MAGLERQQTRRPFASKLGHLRAPQSAGPFQQRVQRPSPDDARPPHGLEGMPPQRQPIYRWDWVGGLASKWNCRSVVVLLVDNMKLCNCLNGISRALPLSTSLRVMFWEAIFFVSTLSL